MRRGQQYALIGVAIVVAVVAFFVLRPDGEEQAAEGGAERAQSGTQQESPGGGAPSGEGGERSGGTRRQQTVVRVESERPVGGPEEIEIKKGDPVRLIVRSDSRQEVHVHGYDLHDDAGPGEPARFRFPADIEGVFEIELEEPGVQIAELKVEP